MASGDGVYNYFEYIHPLNSMDDDHDFSLEIGDVIGFCVAYADNGTNPPPNPFDIVWGWHDIKIAAPFWQGDLVLLDDDVYTITGEFNINGSIIVMENATLIIENAHLKFTQTSSYQFNITLKDASCGNPRLIVKNSTIDTNTKPFKMEFFENSTAQIDGVQLATNCPVYLSLHDLSSADVSNSTFTQILLHNNASLALSSSYIGFLWAVDKSYASMNDATFHYLYASNGAKVHVSNSTIIDLLQVKSSKTQCNIQGIKPGPVAYWNFFKNCSVIEEPKGYAPNVTLNNVQVNSWNFEFADAVNTTIADSELLLLTVSGSSFVCAHRVCVELVSISGFSIVNVTDSRAGNVYVYGSSVLQAVNSTATTTSVQGQSIVYVSWYLDVHVVDSIGQDVPAANVTVVCADGMETVRGQTNATGWVKLTVVSSIINATGEYPQGPHNITASYETYSNATIINVTRNMQTTVVLPDFIIPESPTVLPLIATLVTVLLAVVAYRKRKRLEKRWFTCNPYFLLFF
ncbi:MAG: carboxypeptidase-like regulatory domain-containing protein [Candidatus Bathyarchaeia archaeon]